jgi:anti-anti-sigma factor
VHPYTLTWCAETAQAVLTVSGDIGGSPEATRTFAEGLTRLAELCTEHEPAVPVVDLTGVGFLESSALNALALLHRAIGRPVHLRLTDEQAFVRRVLSLSGLDHIFVIDTAPPAAPPA